MILIFAHICFHILLLSNCFSKIYKIFLSNVHNKYLLLPDSFHQINLLQIWIDQGTQIYPHNQMTHNQEQIIIYFPLISFLSMIRFKLFEVWYLPLFSYITRLFWKDDSQNIWFFCEFHLSLNVHFIHMIYQNISLHFLLNIRILYNFSIRIQGLTVWKYI